MIEDLRPVECPDAEQLAEYVEGLLTGSARASVEQHLQECEICREVVAHVVRVRDASVRVVPIWRRPTLFGGVLAVAASLLVVAQLQPEWNPFHQPTPGDDSRVLAAAPKLQKLANEEVTPQSLHALGIAHLTVGRPDDAVAALERAIAASPQSYWQSDLAAAYLARAERADRPEDYSKALAAADRAIRSDTKLVEAYFNRALALEALRSRAAADAAWRDYLERDPASEWSEEARRHQSSLRCRGLGSSRPCRIKGRIR